MASKSEFQAAREYGYERAIEDIILRVCPPDSTIETIEELEAYLRVQATVQYTHGFEEGKKVARGDTFCQEIYNDGYKQGQKDADARFAIGQVRAQNQQMRDLQAIKKLYEQDTRLSEDYRHGYAEALERYLGVIEFSRDCDKYLAKEVVEEQMRIVRNRLENRYHESVENGNMDYNTYGQITACIDAVYQELFLSGVRVGMGELIGPQKITVHPPKDGQSLPYLTLCKGKNCPIRDNCQRYVFGMNHHGPAVWFKSQHYDTDKGKCDLYLGN